MKNNWLDKVLGEASSVTPAKMPSTVLRQVIGEDEAPDTEGEVPPPAEEHPADVIEPEASAEAEPGGGDRVGDPVQSLVALWTSGGKMDVAVKLLTGPISNSEFVRLVLTLGNEGGALELGQILDDMQAGAGAGEETPQDNVLARVSNIHAQRSANPEEDEAADFRERHAEGDPTAIAAGEQ